MEAVPPRPIAPGTSGKYTDWRHDPTSVDDHDAQEFTFDFDFDFNFDFDFDFEGPASFTGTAAT
jgi:hypothetical protein